MCFTWDFWSPFLSLRNVSKRTPLLVASHHPLYRRFQVWALPSHPSLTSCEWGLSVSHWREALVCVSRSRTALDYVWMGDSRGVLNCGDVCSSHPRKVLYCVCTRHSKDTLACACPGPHCWWTRVCLVTFSKKLCPSVSDTAGSYEGPAAVKQSELCSVSHSREALGWACAIPSRGFQAGSQDSLVPAVYSKEVTSSNTSSSLGEVIGSLSDRYEFWGVPKSTKSHEDFAWNLPWRKVFIATSTSPALVRLQERREQNSVICLFSKVSTRERLEEHTSILYFFSRFIEI